MNNKEFEISFKVDSLDKYYLYFESNDYKLVEDTKQIRTLYKKDDGTMARITIKNNNGTIVKELDFKDDNNSVDLKIERRESKSIEFMDDDAIMSIIDFLGYKKSIELKRDRRVYKKNDIKIEIDEYISPEKMNVVAIEGDKNIADKIYNKIIREVI